jgi:predicted nucleic acid-binding protein
VNLDVARKFGEVDADLLDRGLTVPDVDLFNAAVALNHGLRMVTHNVKDYANVPGLPIDDWIVP